MLYFSPKVLHENYRRFLLGFDGLVTYAVKANASSLVLDNLASAGLTTFDVASPAEMQTVRAALPSAVLHYNNPMRSLVEIAEAKRFWGAAVGGGQSDLVGQIGGAANRYRNHSAIAYSSCRRCL